MCMSSFTSRSPSSIRKLFETDIFAISVLAMFLLGAGMFGAISYLTYFAQIGLGESATNTGVILTPMMLGFIVSSIVGGQLMARTGRYKILVLVGFAVGAFGMFLLSRMTTSTTNGDTGSQHDRHWSGYRRADEPLHDHRTERV